MTNKTPYYLAFTFFIISFITGCISTFTGYWYVAQGEGRLFKRMGLWEACFDGYMHNSDYIGKAYYGCWWIFHKEYSYIRDWLLPPWFIAVQTMMTFNVVCQLIGVFLFPGTGHQISKSTRETTMSVITGLSTLFLMLATLIFGAMIGLDRTWMPRPDENEPSWSYGCAVISGFFAAFSCISISTYTMMRNYDLKYRTEKSDNSRIGIRPFPPRI